MSILPQTSLMMEPTVTLQSKCFICSEVFNTKELAEHEKMCLSLLQDNLSNVTKEIDTLLNVDSESVKSITSSGSNENSHRSVRCYICGEEFGSHFIAVHERQCKRKWDSGLTNNGSLKKGASLGHIPVTREIEKGKKKWGVNNDGVRKAQSVANLALHGPKQAWNARVRDKESSETLSNETRKKRTVKRERPKSAFVKSASTQNLDHDLFSGKEFYIYDDSSESSKVTGLENEKAASMQDLSSDATKSEEIKSRTPKFIECQYCFKMFSIHSIHIHEKKCLCRADIEKVDKGRPKRRSLQNSRCTSVNKLNIANGITDWSVERQLSKSLAVSSDNISSQKQVMNGDSLRFLSCSYCSKPFGSKSLPIHLPQCQKKYEREHGLEGTRRTAKHKTTHNNDTDWISEKLDLKETPFSSLSPFAQSPAVNASLSEKTPLRSSSKRSSASTPKAGASTCPRNGTPGNRKKSNPNEKRVTSSAPRINASSSCVACRFCNNYYGSASVKIHETKCCAKLKRQEDEKHLVKPPRRQLGRLFGMEM